MGDTEVVLLIVILNRKTIYFKSLDKSRGAVKTRSFYLNQEENDRTRYRKIFIKSKDLM